MLLIHLSPVTATYTYIHTDARMLRGDNKFLSANKPLNRSCTSSSIPGKSRPTTCSTRATRRPPVSNLRKLPAFLYSCTSRIQFPSLVSPLYGIPHVALAHSKPYHCCFLSTARVSRSLFPVWSLSKFQVPVLIQWPQCGLANTWPVQCEHPSDSDLMNPIPIRNQRQFLVMVTFSCTKSAAGLLLRPWSAASDTCYGDLGTFELPLDYWPVIGPPCCS